ncbi:MAG TPA: hypothetical protein VGI28_17630 [Stellaceae bacterium]|jgi:hypothetical protein
MADGDLTGSLPLDSYQPFVDFSASQPTPDQLSGGSPGALSAPTPTLPAATTTPTTTPTTGTGGGIGNWLSTTGGNIGNWVSSNPMTALGAVAGGGMLLNQMFGSSSDAEAQTMKQIGQQAASAQSTATMLQAPLTSGVLPPGAEAAVKQAETSGKAAEVSAYTKAGMGASTGLADAEAANAQRAQAMRFGIAQNMFSQAANYSKMASTDYVTLLHEQMQQDQDFSNALSKFVSALAGGRSTSSTTTAS